MHILAEALVPQHASLEHAAALAQTKNGSILQADRTIMQVTSRAANQCTVRYRTTPGLLARLGSDIAE